MSLLLFYTLLSNFSSMFLRSPYLTTFLLPEVLQNSRPMVGKWQTLPGLYLLPYPSSFIQAKCIWKCRDPKCTRGKVWQMYACTTIWVKTKTIPITPQSFIPVNPTLCQRQLLFCCLSPMDWFAYSQISYQGNLIPCLLCVGFVHST